MAASVHQALAGGGIGQARAFLHRQSVHVDPQPHRGPVVRSQLREHPRAADRLPNAPAQLAQLTGHQSSRLVFLTTEFRMGMQMPAQLQKLGELTAEPIGEGNSHHHLKRPPTTRTPSDRPWAVEASDAPVSTNPPGDSADPAPPPRPSGSQPPHWPHCAREGR